MASKNKLAKGLVILFLGFVLGVISSWAYFDYLPRAKHRIFSVKSIESHYPHENENSETTLIVYREGESGHVDEILCQFPPDQNITEKVLKRVKVKEISKKYMFNVNGYYCEAIPSF